MKKNKHFWEKNLSYDFSCILNEETLTVTITLSCKLWYENKINTLLEKPLGLGISQGEEKPKILFFSTIEVDVDFHKISYIRGSYNALKLTDSRELFSSINQYFSSLIISQLEFKFPIVFSSLVRKRISSQEALLAPISYSLTGTSHLIPIIIEMISKDKTATTCVSLLLPKTKHIEYPMNII